MSILFQSFAVGIGAFFGGCLRSILSTVLNQKGNRFGNVKSSMKTVVQKVV